MTRHCPPQLDGLSKTFENSHSLDSKAMQDFQFLKEIKATWRLTSTKGEEEEELTWHSSASRSLLRLFEIKREMTCTELESCSGQHSDRKLRIPIHGKKQVKLIYKGQSTPSKPM